MLKSADPVGSSLSPENAQQRVFLIICFLLLQQFIFRKPTVISLILTKSSDLGLISSVA